MTAGPRLHRPRGADLRQLASVRHARRGAPLRLLDGARLPAAGLLRLRGDAVPGAALRVDAHCGGRRDRPLRSTRGGWPSVQEAVAPARRDRRRLPVRPRSPAAAAARAQVELASTRPRRRRARTAAATGTGPPLKVGLVRDVGTAPRSATSRRHRASAGRRASSASRWFGRRAHVDRGTRQPHAPRRPAVRPRARARCAHDRCTRRCRSDIPEGDVRRDRQVGHGAARPPAQRRRDHVPRRAGRLPRGLPGRPAREPVAGSEEHDRLDRRAEHSDRRALHLPATSPERRPRTRR